ncbi:glycosyltransferase [bacterium]|nr:glycosyltransferase [bacterium]
MKTVLLISQAFPPIAHSASKRAGCLAKYLPEFGWKPVVVCQKWEGGNRLFAPGQNCFTDPKFVSALPQDLPVRPVPVPDLARHSPAYWMDLARRVMAPHRRPLSFLENGRTAVRALYDEHAPAAIWATAPWVAPHLLAAWARQEWDTPWIADFRDIIGEKFENLFTSAIDPIRRHYEKRYLPSASAVVTVSQALADQMQERHERDVQVIYNGFDPEDFAETPAPPLDRFRIVYTGAVNREHPDYRLLLEAVADLVKSGEIPENHIAIEFYGKGNRDRLGPILGDHPSRNLVHIHESVPREECVRVQRSAAVLLQNAFPKRKGIMTGKVFEYLAARRPILAIPGDGDCIDRLLDETGAGVSCGSIDGIRSRLLQWIQEWKRTGTVTCQADPKAVMRYSRRNEAGQVARILDDITESKPT